ncbi:hypothetical protein GC176_04760 [bacterium]|nr:hypothetical protein [bacterium]
MRRHRWLAQILITLISIGVLPQTRAQDQAPPGFGGSQVPSYGLDPSMFHGGQAPLYYQSWPGTNPYMGAGQQLSNEHGLWEYENLSDLKGRRRYRLRAEYVRSRTERGRDRIGNPNAPTYKQEIIPVLQAAGGTGGGGGQANLSSYADELAGTTGHGSFNLFDPVSGGEIEQPTLNGVRLTLEGENLDGSGFEVWGLWANDDHTDFNARDYVHPSRGGDPGAVLFFLDPTNATFGMNPAQDPTGTPDPNEVFQRELLNLRGIPLDDGSFVQIGNTLAGGASAVYDLDFRIATHLEMYGTGLRWKGFKIMERGNFIIRPMGGIRLNVFRDTFSFYGRDSGLLYDGQTTGTTPPLPDVKIHSIPNGYDDNQDGIIDNAGLIEDSLGGQGGGNNANNTTATFTTAVNDFNLTFPITSILKNQVRSYLAGPEVGLNYLIGEGKAFRLGGSTVVGLLANHQRINLSGDNIFVTTRPADLNPQTPDNATPNVFASRHSNTSVSPLLEQEIFVEGPVLAYVPLLRRSPLLRKANLRASYTYTWIGELTRAADSIYWQGNPSMDLYPQIQVDRSTWRANTWNFGISWAW